MFSKQNEPNEPSPQAFQHGGHELFDVHEVLNAMIGALNQCVILRENIQDSELLSILDRQYGFMLDEYNITTEAFRTGQDPQHPTRSYKMQTGNEFEYGIKVNDPKKPIQAANEIDDSIIAGTLLGIHKAGAVGKTGAALETTNPVVRRILQDSVPNCVEMAYELSIYMNKKGWYQVAQLAPQDAVAILNLYGQASPAKNMPN